MAVEIDETDRVLTLHEAIYRRRRQYSPGVVHESNSSSAATQ